jgi:hypothetical protein
MATVDVSSTNNADLDVSGTEDVDVSGAAGREIPSTAGPDVSGTVVGVDISDTMGGGDEIVVLMSVS